MGMCKLSPGSSSDTLPAWLPTTESSQVLRLVQRRVLLAGACVARSAEDFAGDWSSLPWLREARAHWHGPTSMPQALTSEDLRSYFGHVAQIQGWQADPISREQLHVSEACICLELQHLVRPPTHDTSQTPAATTVEPSSVEVHTAKRSRLEPHGLARPLPHRTTWTLADSTVDRYMPAHAFGRGTLADSLAMHSWTPVRRRSGP